MNINMPNYAAALPPAAEKPPLAVLREFAATMEKKTGEMVGGSVFIMNTGGTDYFRYTFYLLASELNDYTEPLFYVTHGAQPYPCKVLFVGNRTSNETNCTNLESFTTELERVFASDLTRQKIYTLIDMVKASRSR